MTIEQTVEIPADHRLVLNLPEYIPSGTADMKVTIISRKKTGYHTAKSLKNLSGRWKNSPHFGGDGLLARIRAFLHDHSPFRSAFSKHFYEFYGCARGAGVFEGDAADIVREWRGEWPDPWERSAATDGGAVPNGKT
jgi:hypothetical protein